MSNDIWGTADNPSLPVFKDLQASNWSPGNVADVTKGAIKINDTWAQVTQGPYAGGYIQWAGIVASTAIQELGAIVPVPQFSNNTATPTPTTNAVNVASGGIATSTQEVVSAPSMPTITSDPIKAWSLNIPATTPPS